MNQPRATLAGAGGDLRDTPRDNPPLAALDTIGWDTAVELASKLAETGADEQAAEVLAGPLSGLDPATAHPHHLVIAAAILYARCVDPLPDLAPDDVAWATYAYRASRTLHGAAHPVTVEATEALALVLFSRDRHAEADALRRELIQLHLDRGDLDAHLHARMDLAMQLHDAGRCGDAVRQATAAWQQWTSRHDPTAKASLSMALPLMAMLLACGRAAEAAAVIEAADLRLPTAGDLTGGAYQQYLTDLAASAVLHRPTCARNLDRTLTADAAADRNA